MESKNSCKVCVTGGAGYIGSSLVNLLLQNGYTVHATLRNLGDESKVRLLKGFPYANERLHLFEVDIYNSEDFEKAIRGCEFVFHVASVMQHTTGYKYDNRIEATITATKKIANACIKSRTVRKLIYTASVVTASPLKDDGSGYKIIMDENCWTPLHLNVPYNLDFKKEYTEAKTKSEKEILKIGDEKASELEMVTLGCGLVGGGSHLPYCASSVLSFVSQIVNSTTYYESLRYLEELLGKIPIVHVEDVCRAHIFCAETPSIKGRFLCASSYVSSVEIADYYQGNYPQYHINKEYLEGPRRDIKWGSKKLEDKGFSYKYDTKYILDDCVEYAKRCRVV